jgi:PAS domain S-box-containing protein
MLSLKWSTLAGVLCKSTHVDVELIQNQSVVLFRQLVDGVPQVMGSIKDLKDRHVYANDGFCARLGLESSEVLGRTVRELFGDELSDSYLAQDELVLKKSRPLQNHLELIVRADGQLGWYVTSKSVIRSETGDPIGIAVLSVDLHSQVNSAHAGLARVITAIREQIDLPWRVAQMAEIAGVSSASLERLARRTLGLPPQQLLQRLRLEHAVFLITQTTLSMGDIAAECGFYDQSSFTRQFRKVLGLTPGAYRRVG